MSKVRVLVGTRKGAFILTSDGKREKWDVSGPHFAGWEIYHLKGSPADPDRLYASQTSGWFGQIIQRSSDGGKTWETPGGEAMPTPGHARWREQQIRLRRARASGKPLTTHQWYDGTQHPVGIQARLASRAVADRSRHGLRRRGGCGAFSLDRRRPNLAGTVRPARPRHRPQWQPGAGGMCLHTIVLDPSNPQRMFIAISAAGAFRTDDGGETWKPINRGLQVAIHSRPECRSRPLRAPHRDAPRRGRACSSCRSTGT